MPLDKINRSPHRGGQGAVGPQCVEGRRPHHRGSLHPGAARHGGDHTGGDQFVLPKTVFWPQKGTKSAEEGSESGRGILAPIRSGPQAKGHGCHSHVVQFVLPKTMFLASKDSQGRRASALPRRTPGSRSVQFVSPKPCLSPPKNSTRAQGRGRKVEGASLPLSGLLPRPRGTNAPRSSMPLSACPHPSYPNREPGTKNREPKLFVLPEPAFRSGKRTGPSHHRLRRCPLKAIDHSWHGDSFGFAI